jgi:guanylate kinase
MKTDDEPDLRIGIVGPCTSGKSTLIQNLEKVNIKARHIAQEHSYVQDMWKRMTNPDILIFLDVSYTTSILRRNLNWTPEEYQEEQRRLAHARKNATLYLFTDPLNQQEVLDAVIYFIQSFSKGPNK